MHYRRTVFPHADSWHGMWATGILKTLLCALKGRLCPGIQNPWISSSRFVRLRENPALGRGGRGKGATPRPMAGPRGQDCHAAPPPRPTGGIARGPKGPPDSPPPPPTQARERAGGRPPHPPSPHPPQLGSHRRGPPPPQGRGGARPLRRNGDAVRTTAAGPAPANPHRRAGATRTTEQEGGRAPHDPPVTTAHSEVTEGGFRSAGAPGGAVHGPPLTPPHPGAALQPRPHARAGRERAGDTERARKEYRRPPPGTRAGRPRRDTPPPRPPTSPPAAGAPAATPRGRGIGPPPPERGAGV